MANYSTDDGQDTGEPETDVPETVEEQVIYLRDFTAGEDTLSIEVVRPEGETGRALASAEVVPVTIGSNTYANLVLTFEATDTEPELIATVRFADQSVTMEDIQLSNT